MIRMVDTAGRHAAVAEDAERRVRDVLRSGRYVGGPAVAEAERWAARFFHAHGAVGVNSGTDALILALQAFDIGPGDEVLVPALSFYATTEAILAVGATPVFVDVREDALLDPGAVDGQVTDRTRALIAVHLYGNRASPPPTHLFVLDDAAQAVGAEPPARVGALTAVSAYPTKVWGAAGDGGFVVGDDPTLLDRVRALANHAMSAPHVHHRVGRWAGRNSRLDAVQAAVLAAHAPQVAARVVRRRSIAARYDADLPPAIRPLPRDPGGPVAVYAARCRERDDQVAQFARRGIEAGAYYPLPMHLQAASPPQPGRCPVAEALSRELIALPVHEGLTDDDVQRVISAAWEIAG